MKRLIRGLTRTLMGLGLMFAVQGEGVAALKKGTPLPNFQLASIDGKRFSNNSFSGPKPGVIYLFKTQKCKTCLKGLDHLKSVNREFGKEMTIIAIGKDDKKPLSRFANGLGLDFPVLPGDKALFKTFRASLLPTTLLVGPDSRVIRVIHGGGKHVADMLTTLAENQLQRKNSASAKKLFLRASKTGSSVVARAGIAYSHLKSGEEAEAEKSFRQMASSKDRVLAIQGKEGLAELMFKKGQKEEALKIVNEVLTESPKRTMANLVKGKVLYAKGQKKEAEKALVLASADNIDSDFAWQKAEANLALGNMHMGDKKSSIALKSYKKAAVENPYLAEALSNQGVALKEMGEPEKALEVFKSMKKIHPDHHLVHSLLRQAQSAIAQKQDLEYQKYVDGMVKDLVTRFRSQQASHTKSDDWTSPIGAVSILGFQNNQSGSLMGHIGMEGILKDELARELADRNVSVVEREVLDKVMAELKLGSSELANKKTQTKLGKITAAHILATGSFYDAEKGSLATMRLVETETTDIFLALSKKEKNVLKPGALAAEWADRIAARIKEQFPLKGRIVKIKPKEVIINLGKRHAVTKGMVFNVLSKGEAIDLGDGEVEYDFSPIGQIKVTRVRHKMAFAKIVSKEGDWKNQQKIIVVQ